MPARVVQLKQSTFERVILLVTLLIILITAGVIVLVLWFSNSRSESKSEPKTGHVQVSNPENGQNVCEQQPFALINPIGETKQIQHVETNDPFYTVATKESQPNGQNNAQSKDIVQSKDTKPVSSLKERITRWFRKSNNENAKPAIPEVPPSPDVPLHMYPILGYSIITSGDLTSYAPDAYGHASDDVVLNGAAKILHGPLVVRSLTLRNSKLFLNGFDVRVNGSLLMDESSVINIGGTPNLHSDNAIGDERHANQTLLDPKQLPLPIVDLLRRNNDIKTGDDVHHQHQLILARTVLMDETSQIQTLSNKSLVVLGVGANLFNVKGSGAVQWA